MAFCNNQCECGLACWRSDDHGGDCDCRRNHDPDWKPESQRKLENMGHKEKLVARQKELVAAIAPMQKELDEINELLGVKKPAKKKSRHDREGLHRDSCFSEGCVGQCMVR